MPARSNADHSDAPRLKLTILATSDLHANLLPYDYDKDCEAPRGLARLSHVITRLRAQNPNCLLVDNGDTLQGTALGDWAAETRVVHPMITAMNQLGYDAATCGNHDFDYGLERLETAINAADYPVVLANLRHCDGRALLPGSVCLERQFLTDSGATEALRVGIIGLTPPQVTRWSQSTLKGALESLPIVATARAEAAKLRAAGADLILALCHSGLGEEEDAPDLENAILPLAREGGVDAIIAGHSHEVFPRAGAEGLIAGVPVVQPGFYGSHLGVITLELTKDHGLWKIMSGRGEVHSPSPQTHAPPALLRTSEASHEATLAFTQQQIGHCDCALESYFPMVAPCPALGLVAQASLEAARNILATGGRPLDRPLLAAVAPFKTGGRGGAGFYTDIEKGPVSMRALNDLYMFTNALQVIEVTGADLWLWLERVASAFHQITPGKAGQLLLDPDFSGYNFDVLAGLSYQFDLSQPALYSPDGAERREGPGRVRALTFAGERLRDDQVFWVATNSYRAAGGGHFEAPTRGRMIVDGQDPVREALLRYVKDRGHVAPNPLEAWSFTPLGGTEVILETGPGARRHATRINAIGLRDLGQSDTGFARFGLKL